MQKLKWTVVGAGPAGIAAVGRLLDKGSDQRPIAWIDPHFRVGDFGAKWANVSGNTKVRKLEQFLHGSEAFGYRTIRDKYSLRSLDPEGTCLLRDVAEPLQQITDSLKEKVETIRSKVTGMTRENGVWHLQTPEGVITSVGVILAIGAEQKRLNYKTASIDLENVLDSNLLPNAVSKLDSVAVFGSSHSAIMAIRNLLEFGVEKVINFYRSPIQYATDLGSVVFYDNTGLKGTTAEWARTNMDNGKTIQNLTRVLSNKENIVSLLPMCTKAVYAVGFEARSIPGHKLRHNEMNGEISEGLFGCGIAFPETVLDVSGGFEKNIGLLKFMRHIDSAMPTWILKTS